METETPHKKSSSGFGPGLALAKARASLGLTHEEVAERLRLAPRQVQALEADDYGHLPGPTYVRGYLRSYAEMVGLASGPIIEAYSHVPTPNRTANLDSIAPKEEVTSQHRHVRLATYALVAIIIALAASWWQGRSRHRVAATAVRKHATVPAAPAASEPVPPQAEPVPQRSAPVSQRSAPVSQRAGSHAASSMSPTVAPAPVPGHSAQPVPVRVRPAAALSKTTAAPTRTVVTGSTSAAVAPGAAGGRALLVLTTTQDCWVDVRDAQGNKLLYETVPAGRVVTLDGNTPLKVFLGNAAGVQVEFDGKPFNQTPYIRGQVARFILGATGGH